MYQSSYCYLQKLPDWRREFCEAGLATYGGIILTDSLQQSLDFVNEYAPEHLEVLVSNPFVGEVLRHGVTLATA